MEILQDLFMSTLKENMTLEKLGTKLIAAKFEKLGIVLTEEQERQIEKDLTAGQHDNFKIDISDDQLEKANLSEAQASQIVIDLSDEKETDETIDRMIKDMLMSAQTEIADLFLKDFQPHQSRKILHQHQKERADFERQIHRVWGKALELLESLLLIGLEAGYEFNQEFRPIAVSENDYLFDALVRLHARACQVSFEVLTLLKSGYADGAHARWRTLHEISVVAYFLKKHGQSVAERYLCHDVIESYKAAQEQQNLGYETATSEEIIQLGSTKDAMIERFGRNFANQYGWASEVLNKESPSFKDIEEDVELGHIRPYYRLASHNVHANPKGIMFKMGYPPRKEDILMAGASLFGLADPGQGTAISLSQVTTTLLMTKPNLDRIVTCTIMQKLTDEIKDAFIQVHIALEEKGHDPNNSAN